MPTPDQPVHAFDGTRTDTRRERFLWNLWLATVALLVVGSLVAWLLIISSPVRPPARTAVGTRPTRVTPSYNPAYQSMRPAAPVLGPGIVWVNTRSKVYHYPGYRWYGTTLQGKFTSETDAVVEGDRAARNERRPMSFYATPMP